MTPGSRWVSSLSSSESVTDVISKNVEDCEDIVRIPGCEKMCELRPCCLSHIRLDAGSDVYETIGNQNGSSPLTTSEGSDQLDGMQWNRGSKPIKTVGGISKRVRVYWFTPQHALLRRVWRDL